MKERWENTFRLWWFGITKVPLIFLVNPVVVTLNEQRAEIKIPLSRRTKNHLGSMYFGALCIGADIAGGIHLMYLLKSNLKTMSFVFKDFSAEFLKRPEADVHFITENGQAVQNAITQAIETKTRVNMPVNVIAITPKHDNETVARFTLTLSLKPK